MRHMAVAGTFYPADKSELKKQINSFFSSLDVASIKSKNIKAAIVPHAGYTYSGRCASFAYKHLDSQKFDSFIILGTNHSGLGRKISLSIEDFDTPFGTIEADIEVIEQIIMKGKKAQIDMGVEEQVHKYEHSIEVQLPFLQNFQKNFKIVPILLSGLSLKEIKEFGKIIASVISEKNKLGKKIFVLASSDFTHYGASYGFVPFHDNIGEKLYELDGKVIDKVLDLDSEGFLKEASKTTVCGKDAIASCIEVCRNLKLKAEKVCYYTSGEISQDWDSAVGYASVIFS